MTTGDCFQAALHTAAELRQLGHHPLVVHGLPVGRSGEVEGKRYWHAWVEVEVPDDARGGTPTWTVCDWSNGQARIFIARQLFYRLGQVRQHLLWRYTLVHALEQLDEYGHTGPWMDRARADALDETGGAGWVSPQPVDKAVGE